jgi:hypothetical protein
MKFYIGYYSDTKTKKFIIKDTTTSKEQADKINKELSDRLNKFEFNQDKHFMGDTKPRILLRYKILTEKEYNDYLIQRKQTSITKRKTTLAQKTPEQRQKTYILCPKCKAHSKLLYSEFGGYQTRKCKNGHTFNYDKWIGDRLCSIMIFGNPARAAEWAFKKSN